MAYLETYNLTAGQVDKINVNNLSSEIIDSGSVDEFTNILYTEGSTSFTVYGSDTLDKPALDIVVSDYLANFFPEYQAKKNEKIDEKTVFLISLGYTYDTNKQFSLSTNAQRNLLDYYNRRADLSIYPIRLNTIDNADAYDISDPTDMEAIYLHSLNVKRGHRDSGTAYKDSVRISSTEEEVDAIEDIR